ncbi:phthiocerol/phthiodiolone dimycocerosyl transferase family protein [Streptomyces bauhiniae]
MVVVNAVRELSDGEAAFAYTHALMGGTTQVTTQVTVREDIAPGPLHKAVEQWAGELPLLGLRIEEHADTLWFAQGPGVLPDQLRHSTLASPDSLDDLLRRELNEVLETGGPLWRLHAVRDPRAGATHLYFTRNHAISDGHSTGAVIRALLDALFPSSELSPYDVRRLPPDADGLAYGAPAGQGFVQPPPERLPFAEHRPWEERRADFVPCTLTRTESVTLKTWCKQQGVTVNQFFAAALAESYAEVTGRTEVGMFTAVSLRQRYADLPDVGCFINVLRVPMRPGRGQLTDLAREYGAALRSADAAWRPPVRSHAAIRRAVEETAAAGSAPGICVTNVGVVDPALGPHLNRVSGYRTIVNRTGANYGLVLHLGTLDGTFSPALAFGTPAVDRSSALDVAKGLHDRAVRPQGAA